VKTICDAEAGVLNTATVLAANEAFHSGKSVEIARA